MRYPKFERPERFALSRTGSFLLLLATILTGCTTSVRPVDSMTFEKPVVERSPKPEKEESGLTRMSAEELITEGRALLDQGNTEVARLHFIMAIKKDPQAVGGYIGLGKIMHRQGRFEEASTFFGRALELQPSSVPALLGQARTFRAHGDAETALDYLRSAHDLQSENPEILTELAFTHDALGQVKEAEELYREVVALNPRQASAYNNLGYSYLLQDRYAEAISAFGRALALKPGNSRFKNNLGAAYALQGDGEKAFRLFESTMGAAAAHNNLGYLYMTQGKLNLAEKSLNLALDLNPTFYEKARQNLDRLESLRTR